MPAHPWEPDHEYLLIRNEELCCDDRPVFFEMLYPMFLPSNHKK